MELVQVKENQIAVSQQVIEELKAFEVQKAQMQIKEKELKEALLKAMEENNIKKFENDDIRITYIGPTTRVSVDTKKLKDEGLFDLYSKESVVKANVRLEYKGN